MNRLEVDLAIADRQVGAFYKRETKVAGKEGMLEVSLVVLSRRQQDDPRIIGAGQLNQSLSLSAKKGARRRTLQSRNTSGSASETIVRFSSA